MTTATSLGSHVDPARRDKLASTVRPAAFRQATPAFQKALCLHIIRLLGDRLAAMPQTRRRLESDDAIRTRAFEMATVAAQSLIPEEWRPSLEEESEDLVARKTTLPAAVHCQSCSVSLLSEHNRGISDRYCRYCSDESGRLKPKDQAQHLIAQWFEHWQGGLTHAEAMRRAGLFMQAMPAWCNN